MTEPLAVILLTGLAAFVVGLSKGGLPSVGTLGVPLMALAMSPVVAAALLLPIYLATDLVACGSTGGTIRRATWRSSCRPGCSAC